MTKSVHPLTEYFHQVSSWYTLKKSMIINKKPLEYPMVKITIFFLSGGGGGGGEESHSFRDKRRLVKKKNNQSPKTVPLITMNPQVIKKTLRKNKEKIER